MKKAIISNPPYSIKWDPPKLGDPRFEHGLAPKSKADFAFVQHSLSKLSDNDELVVVLPHGILFRGASEGKIRQSIIDSNLLVGVIGLPPNLFYGTSISVCIMIFSKSKKDTDVFFIDCKDEFQKGKNQNFLTDEHLEKITNTFKNREIIDKYSNLVTLEEIQSNDYNLNIPRYVDTFEEEEVIPLNEILDKMEQIDKDIKKCNSELSEMLGQLVSTDDDPDFDEDIRRFRELLK